MSDNKELLKLVPKSASLRHFNCLGFAVGIFDWICPDKDVVEDAETFISTLVEDVNYYCINDGEYRIRVVDSEKDLVGNEYLVLVSYDLSSYDPDDWNFHAIRRYHDRWVDKLGDSEIEYIPDDIDPLRDDWTWGDVEDYLSPGSPVEMFAVNPDVKIDTTYRLDKSIWFAIPTGVKVVPNTTFKADDLELKGIGDSSCCLEFDKNYIVVNSADQDIMGLIDESTLCNYSIRTAYFNDKDHTVGRVPGYLV